MITNGKKWYYLAVKELPVLLRGVTSKHDGDFHCLNCLHSFRTENKLKKHENVCKIMIFAIQKCLKKTKKY